MFSRLLRFAAPGALVLVLGATSSQAMAQNRGINIPIPGVGSGGARPTINVGPSGVNVGPSYAPGTYAPGTYNPYGYNRTYPPGTVYAPGTTYPPGTTYVPGTGYVTTVPSATSAAPVIAPEPQNNRAVMNIRVPANAKVFVGNTEVASQSGDNRQVISPPLESGSSYQYDLRAQWNENGRTVERTRSVTIHPGDRVTVDFLQGS